MNVELFYRRCAEAREGLKAVTLEAAPDMVWREINALEELDYAVELGVLTLPSVAINSVLVFSSLPTPAQLASELQQRLGKEFHDGH
jgi:thioredoxin 1